MLSAATARPSTALGSEEKPSILPVFLSYRSSPCLVPNHTFIVSLIDAASSNGENFSFTVVSTRVICPVKVTSVESMSEELFRWALAAEMLKSELRCPLFSRIDPSTTRRPSEKRLRTEFSYSEYRNESDISSVSSAISTIRPAPTEETVDPVIEISSLTITVGPNTSTELNFTFRASNRLNVFSIPGVNGSLIPPPSKETKLLLRRFSRKYALIASE